MRGVLRYKIEIEFGIGFGIEHSKLRTSQSRVYAVFPGVRFSARVSDPVRSGFEKQRARRIRNSLL